MYTYDSICLYKDNKPWFPFMGEVHYSRLPEHEWRDALYRIKMGGVDVVASYCFWIHHEEIKGDYDFTGCRDLRLFVQTVKDCGLSMFLRIGPWSHGEARNGGFPDWLLKEDCELRKNDPKYFALVQGYYQKLYEQVEGLLLKNGGPIIGVQIENEYGHVGGLTGDAGEEHMRTLTNMAKQIGFDVPLYTATGWNGAVLGDCLPVMGGYCDAPWDRGITQRKPNENFVFTHERNDIGIGSDAGLGSRLSYDMHKFPYLTAELGGGLQVTHHRRTMPAAKDTAAMSVVKMGSGCNLLGYYMYHGGRNPQGKLTTLQETYASGGYNDLPELSYDFQAPLGAYSQIHPSYHELRLLAMFVKDFGADLCVMPAMIPEDNPKNPADIEHLRYSFRHNGTWGYAFINNHVRHMSRPNFKNVVLTVPGMDVVLPPMDIAPGQFGFYPYNMPVHGGMITFAEATPLCTINQTMVLYGTRIDATGDVLLISKDDALQSYKIIGAQEHLMISNQPLIQSNEGIEIFAEADVRLKVYPAWNQTPDGFEYIGTDGVFAVYERKKIQSQPTCRVEKISEYMYRLTCSDIPETADDVVCRLHYTADCAEIYVDGKKVMDDFYTDGHWQINLRRHGFPNIMDIVLRPLKKDDFVYLEAWPLLEKGQICRLDNASVVSVERIVIH